MQAHIRRIDSFCEMKGTPLLALLAVWALNSVQVAYAQSAADVRRIGYLTTSSPTAGPHRGPFDSFRHGLQDLGYIEGKDFVMVEKRADGKLERLPELALELVRMKVDVIVTTTNEASLAAQRATKSIPIVMVGGSDPVGAGLVSSLARPGGNITGTTLIQGDLTRKRLEMLKEIIPNNPVVGVLWIPDDMSIKIQMDHAELAAKALGLRLLPVKVQGPSDYEPAFSELKRGGAGSVMVFSTPVFAGHSPLIAELAAKNRLPAIYGTSTYMNAGGLMSYGTNVPEHWRHVAQEYVGKILKGAKPADMPVETPTKFELLINLKVAKQIGLTIPESVLQRADRLID